MLTLLGTETCPFVRKIRVLALEKRVDLRFEIADPRDDGGAVRRASPIGKVPVLVTDWGVVVFDSPVIAQFVDAQREPRIIPHADGERFEVLHWEAIADAIAESVLYRTLELRRTSTQQVGVVDDEERRIERMLDVLDACAAKLPFLAGEHFGYADICAGVALSYVDVHYMREWRNKRDRLAAWHAKIEARDSLIQTRPPLA